MPDLFSRERIVARWIGSSAPAQKIREMIQQSALRPASVLVEGSPGTGKDFVTQLVYELSQTSTKFLKIEMGTLNEQDYLEQIQKPLTTIIEPCSIYFDHIDKLPPSYQSRLARLLQQVAQERKIRIFASCDMGFDEHAKQENFQNDLLYLLDEIRIFLPPLNHRIDDLPQLADYFLAKICNELSIPVKSISAASLALLKKYPWPGNTAELQSLLKKAVMLTRDRVIWMDSLPLNFSTASTDNENKSQPEPLFEIEKRHIFRVLEYCNWNKKKAASILQIDRSSLYNKIRRFELRPTRTI